MKHQGALGASGTTLRQRLPLVTLIVLLIAAFALGGGSRDDIFLLIVLRPIAVIALGIGLFTLTLGHWQAHRLPLAFMAAIIGLIVLHLIPLPPAIWMALPGRDIAIAAGEAMGGVQPWRPLSLVPYRGWNAFYAMLVPAAAVVLAVQLNRDDHRRLVLLLIAAGLASALWGMVQSFSGFSRGFYIYSVTNYDAVTGLFANRNHMAAFMVAMIPLLAVLGSRASGARKGVLQIACAALAGLFALMALATGSRAGMAFCVVALGASWLIWRARPVQPSQHRRGPAKQPWVPYAVAGFGAIMLVLFGVLLAQSQGLERVLQSGAVEEYRFTVWETIAQALPRYLPLGSGVGSFVEIFKIHEPSEMLGTSYWNHAHNDWLEWALEGGVPAIILMGVAVAGWALRSLALLRSGRTGRFEVQLGIAAAIVLLILGLWSIVDYPLRVPSIGCLAALCAVWLTFKDSAATLGREADSGLSGDTAAHPPTSAKATGDTARERRPANRKKKGSGAA